MCGRVAAEEDAANFIASSPDFRDSALPWAAPCLFFYWSHESHPIAEPLTYPTPTRRYAHTPILSSLLTHCGIQTARYHC